MKDESDRQLEIITQWQECYSTLRTEMKCEVILASTAKDYRELAVVTELWVPSSSCYVGDYPYLSRDKFERLVYSLEADEQMKGLEMEQRLGDLSVETVNEGLNNDLRMFR